MMWVTEGPVLEADHKQYFALLEFWLIFISVFNLLFQDFSTFDVLYKETYINLQFTVLLAKNINILLSKSFFM